MIRRFPERPWARRPDVTVCIAAACIEGEERKIVLCTDRRTGSVLGSAETALKNRTIKDGWRCLTAGAETDIHAMVRLYRAAFRSTPTITVQNIDSIIKLPLQQRKKELADEYIRHRFAISHADFITFGKENSRQTSTTMPCNASGPWT